MSEVEPLAAEELMTRVRDARARTLALVNDLDDAQLTVPKLDIVNPFRWEMGHVAFFYDVFLLRQLGSQSFLLDGAETLYDSFKVDHGDRWGLPLPSREQTLDYMRRVHERVTGRLESRTPDGKETYLYLLCVCHEDMHDEAFTYMRQTLEYAAPQLAGASKDEIAGDPRGALPGDVEVPGATFELGAVADSSFVFDNEKWAHSVDVAPFKIARAPVTNAEFAEFVANQGYRRRELWSHQGWTWRLKTGAEHPLYWTRGGNGWMCRHFDRLLPLQEHAPVIHVNWFEAEAYCSWAGRRLPSEEEWELAASGEPDGNGNVTDHKRTFPWGDQPPNSGRANLDGNALRCVDVAAFPQGDSAFGCRQMLGNVWEWTASDFYPFPGYIVDRPYMQYSAPWFGYRKVLKGGAWATRSRLIRNTFRNFFEPARRDVFAGFRTCAVQGHTRQSRLSA